MDDHPDSTFAPQSPDLNGPDIDFLPPQHQQYRGSISHTLTPFTPTDAKPPWSTDAPYASRTPGWQSHQQQQQHPQQPISYFPPQAQQPYQDNAPSQYPQQPPIFNQNPFATQGIGAVAEQGSWDAMAPSTRGKRVKAELEPSPEAEISNGANSGGPKADIDVRTKFPVARIKRIMQSDEDVGKVAQVTPVVVSKALELFMIDLVTTAAGEARSRSSKRVTAAHLKQAVMSNAKYSDWLGEIVSKAPDAPAASAKAAKDEVDSDDEFFGAAAKKKRKPAARRKKGGDDD